MPKKLIEYEEVGCCAWKELSNSTVKFPKVNGRDMQIGWPHHVLADLLIGLYDLGRYLSTRCQPFFCRLLQLQHTTESMRELNTDP